MFRVKNKLIMNSELQVIQTLQAELHKRGIYKLRKIKPLRNSIQVSCPIHVSKDGYVGGERRPSCGITIGDNAGVVNCFACDYGKKRPIFIEEFISNCFGFKGRTYGTQWLLDNFIIGITQEREPIKLKIRGQEEKEEINYVTEKELDKYRYFHPYMYERGLTDEVIETFDIGFDEKINALTFPSFDKNGNCLFVVRRSIDKKLYHYPAGTEKNVYGEHLVQDKKEVIITEGVLDALKCWSVGFKPSVALMGLGSKHQIEDLKQWRVKKFILAFDADEAGTNTIGRLRESLKSSGKLISEYNLPWGKDLNDLSKKEMFNLKEYY